MERVLSQQSRPAEQAIGMPSASGFRLTGIPTTSRSLPTRDIRHRATEHLLTIQVLHAWCQFFVLFFFSFLAFAILMSDPVHALYTGSSETMYPPVLRQLLTPSGPKATSVHTSELMFHSTCTQYLDSPSSPSEFSSTGPTTRQQITSTVSGEIKHPLYAALGVIVPGREPVSNKPAHSNHVAQISQTS